MGARKEITVDSIRQLLEDKKAFEIVILEVSERCSFTDHLVIASGSSTRQVKALSDILFDEFEKPLSREGEQQAEWVLMDYGDIVVHLFHEQVRATYNLEELWSDQGSPEKLKEVVNASHLQEKERQPA
jgi:ribosome-associated protein